MVATSFLCADHVGASPQTRFLVLKVPPSTGIRTMRPSLVRHLCCLAPAIGSRSTAPPRLSRCQGLDCSPSYSQPDAPESRRSLVDNMSGTESGTVAPATTETRLDSHSRAAPLYGAPRLRTFHLALHSCEPAGPRRQALAGGGCHGPALASRVWWRRGDATGASSC